MSLAAAQASVALEDSDPSTPTTIFRSGAPLSSAIAASCFYRHRTPFRSGSRLLESYAAAAGRAGCRALVPETQPIRASLT